MVLQIGTHPILGASTRFEGSGVFRRAFFAASPEMYVSIPKLLINLFADGNPNLDNFVAEVKLAQYSHLRTLLFPTYIFLASC
jgi:hypothetical protein